ncbi:hypothetical protein [Catenuloplanes indicus]|uniref:hypothetical protein n=1 Tax=Catenuloplanes indicus TaxID=137267 RepID=UPI0027D7E2E9|nr:hypothetical protein [Catenuloplanes indicus]
MGTFKDIVSIAVDRGAALRLAQEAISSLPNLKTHVHVGESVVSARTKVSILSWEEEVMCTAYASSVGTDLHVESRSSFHLTAVDYGVNRKNVEAIVEHIRRIGAIGN